MHSRSLTSPFMIAETNQAVRGPYAGAPGPDPKRFCVNCHSPSAASVSKSPTLPFESDETLWKEGVTCQTCHQFDGPPTSGGAGYSTGFMANLKPGDTVFGTLDDPMPSSAHGSARSEAFERPNAMCGNCHNVNFDLDNDGRIEKGKDLVLQQTFDEYALDYKVVGGTGTCISCHMPAVPGLTRIVNIPEAPEREVHDHSFHGVDYSLDDLEQREKTRPHRTALLRSAATLELDSLTREADRVSFTVAITNRGAGHNLPTGLAFARQVWLEVRALDEKDEVVASSGLLESPTADLCEAELLEDTDNPLSRLVDGCPDGPDRSLVHFQQKLVNAVEPAHDANGNVIRDQLGQPILQGAIGSREVLLQVLRGGVVARKRAIDGTPLGLLRPFETRSYPYRLQTDGASVRRISVRLLFRSVAPYFIRGLAAEPPQDVIGLAKLVDNIEIVEMASVDATLPN